MYLAGSHWYASGTFYSAAGLLAAVLVGIATVVATLFAASTRRQITYHLAEDTPLLSAATPLQADIEVFCQGQRLTSPRVVAIRLTSRSRKDIGSGDFDHDTPLSIDLGVPIVKLLAADADPAISQPYAAVKATRLLIGPCTIRKRHVMTFGLLAEGGKPSLSYSDAPLDVVVRPGGDGKRPPQGFWTKTALAGAGAAVVVGGAAGVTGVGAATLLAGAAGADAGMTELAAGAILAAATAIWTRLKRRHRRR